MSSYTEASSDVREKEVYKCIICDTVYERGAETWDARAVLNWWLKIRRGDREYEASKVGITDDNTLLSYYRGVLEAAIGLGLVEIVE